MIPRGVLPSVRNQWHMTPYSIGFLGNFDYVNEGCLVLDDGSIWFLQPEMGGPAHLASQDYMNSMGTITPEGWTKWTGDHWTSETAAEGSAGAMAMADEYYVWNTQFPPADPSGSPKLFCTDGRYIYYSVTPFTVGTPPAGMYDSGCRVYRLDPQTGLATWIAGAAYPASSYTPLDSHDGRLANLGNGNNNIGFGTWTCDREYIYWNEKKSFTSLGGRVRRMKLEEPYPVETVFVSDDSWTFSERWDIQADGFPNLLQSNFLAYNGVDVAMGAYGDHLYFAEKASLRRLPKVGGSVENILYGGKTLRDDYLSRSGGWSDRPNRIWLGWTSSYVVDDDGNISIPTTFDYPGIPDLDGLDLDQWGQLVPVGNRLFFTNSAVMEGSSSSNLYGRRISYFDMDKLLDTYAKNGPQRVNRENPQWETISNGTAVWEGQPALYNTYPIDVHRPCGWIENSRAGSEPLHGNPGHFFSFNPNAAPPWNERLVFTHMETNFSGHGDWLEWSSDPTQIAWGCSYLEEESVGPTGRYNLTLQFTGDLLKGYAAARELVSAKAPEQVDLGEVSG